jgi:hypothetical protein
LKLDSLGPIYVWSRNHGWFAHGYLITMVS